MWNPRITAKEQGIIKGKLRSAFARSELHRKVLEASIIPGYSDPQRPRVKTWCKCAECGKAEAKSYMDVDHVDPVIPLDRSLKDVDPAELVDRLWTDENNLRALCPVCHDSKTAVENKERRRIRKDISTNGKSGKGTQRAA